MGAAQEGWANSEDPDPPQTTETSTAPSSQQSHAGTSRHTTAIDPTPSSQQSRIITPRRATSTDRNGSFFASQHCRTNHPQAVIAPLNRAPSNPTPSTCHHQPVIATPTTGKPVIATPTTGKPVICAPVTGKPVTGKPVTITPAIAPVTTTPVAAKPSDITAVDRPYASSVIPLSTFTSFRWIMRIYAPPSTGFQRR
ncbi:hypothetical protein [Bifidobacterium eulemuris]|uniref:Uncharacterized protein n=1 Tax=Bifidobacterium eulemuris TaxID=1765219 RepID=A0A261GE15_9BIFI|nr:hypothetical protein [Bifidobacterium eulemuris]OZG69503.1 hypothetical protein BEUL_0244 [Bifidobacterium eulemuris]QOL32143.1 hypothetical protein BE0216_06470 [Bifidobacterium eulemuris]